MSEEIRKCQNCSQEFAIDADDKSFYEKMKVPAPTFCWLCRAQRRLLFRNERNLYKRKSDFSGKEIFSMYSPEAAVKVYEKDIWNSDEWDPFQYGRDYDFSKPFFQQFKELYFSVPLKNLNIVGGVNSDYTNNITDPKNSYLVFNGNNVEECMYSNGITTSKDCVDVSHVGKCETCYESFWLTSCTNTIFSSQCENSFNLAFSKNCSSCNDCFGCVGLRKKSYCIFNEEYSKEEYEKKLAEYDWSSRQGLEKIKKEVAEFWQKFPNKFIEGSHNVNVSGNYIDHSKNVRNCFLVREGENLRYCQYVQELPGSKECYDYSIWGDGNQYIYESCASGINTNNLKFSLYAQENIHDVEYSICCQSSSDLFGCVGLKRKQYCIFNKQYSKEEYEKLVPKIRVHMDEVPYTDTKGKIYKYGEFFPAELSPLAYNETVAYEYFPLTKEEALEKGYTWRAPQEKTHSATLQARELPDKIKLVSDEITREVINCAHETKCSHNCTKVFRIIPQELAFYRKMKLPLPVLCPNCRHFERVAQRTGFALEHRACQCAGTASSNGVYHNNGAHAHGTNPCPKEFETAYTTDRPEIVYCESCYQAEVM